MKELARGGDSDIVGDVPLDCVALLVRIVGAETLSGEGPVDAVSGGLRVADVVLTLTREFVNSVYLKGG